MLAAPFPRSGISLLYGQTLGTTYTLANPHKGIDWSSYRMGKYGAKILASARGVVVFNGRSTTLSPREGHPSSAHGNSIAIRYPDYGVTAHYSHRRAVAGPGVGGLVEYGTELGMVGNTGLSSGEHVHVEVWKGGVRINPALVFDLDVVVGAQAASLPGVSTPKPVPATEGEDDDMCVPIYYVKAIGNVTVWEVRAGRKRGVGGAEWELIKAAYKAAGQTVFYSKDQLTLAQVKAIPDA